MIQTKQVIYVLLIFTLWALFVSVFISDETIWSLKEIKSEWLMPLLYFFTFLFLAIFIIQSQPILEKKIYYIIFIMLFIHILYIDLYALKYYIDHKVFLTRFIGLTEGFDKANYLTNTLLAYLVSEVIYRIKTSKKFLDVNNFLLGILILLTLMSTLIETTRNGIIAILFLGITGAFFALKNNNKFSVKSKMIISTFLFLSFSLPAIYDFKYDHRWQSLFETIPIALDTTNNKAWINRHQYSYPKLQNGETVSPSNYERVAWAYEGIKIILDNPLGTGYGRNAFRHSIQRKYNLQNLPIGHSHSGLIDLGIGVGFLGVILWLTFGILLMYMSYIYFIKYNNFYALILFFNITGFFTRFLVDSNMRDHMFETFMAIIGISFIFMLNEKIKNDEKFNTCKSK